MTGLRPDEHKTCLDAIHENETALRGFERRQKPFTGTNRIKPPDALETFAHRFDADLHQRFDVVAGCVGKGDVQLVMLPG